MTQYALSEDAYRDLDGIWDYIAQDNIDAADHPVLYAEARGFSSG